MVPRLTIASVWPVSSFRATALATKELCRSGGLPTSDLRDRDPRLRDHLGAASLLPANVAPAAAETPFVVQSCCTATQICRALRVCQQKNPGLPGIFRERLKGLEPSTFCMASRRSSQLSYSRAGAEYRPGWPS